jgi:hypothetical protein
VKEPKMKSKVKKQTFEQAIVQIITPLGFVKTGPHWYQKDLYNGGCWVVQTSALYGEPPIRMLNWWWAAKGNNFDIYLPTVQSGKGIASFREFLKKNKLTRRAA